MRPKLSIIGLLLLALCVSGWTSALAAALKCQHAAPRKSHAATAHDKHTSQDHSCCRARVAHAQPHCSTPQQHKAMGGMRAMPVASARAVAISQPDQSCAHCIDRPEMPATPTVGQANQVNPNVDGARLRETAGLAPLAAQFAPPVQSRQGAPPLAASRKHLLLSIFLI